MERRLSLSDAPDSVLDRLAADLLDSVLLEDIFDVGYTMYLINIIKLNLLSTQYFRLIG